MPPEIIARFWVKVRKTDTCWIWTGGKTPYGYGRFTYRKTRAAHRIAWVLTGHPEPKELYLIHKCDNPPCVNPAHLHAGTQLENIRDMIAKGRAKPPPISIKLTPDNVREIRERLKQGEAGMRIARDYDVTKFAIYAIRKGETHTSVV
jgi:hypothetical protein